MTSGCGNPLYPLPAAIHHQKIRIIIIALTGKNLSVIKSLGLIAQMIFTNPGSLVPMRLQLFGKGILTGIKI